MDLIAFWYLIHVVKDKKQYLASRTDGWMDGAYYYISALQTDK